MVRANRFARIALRIGCATQLMIISGNSLVLSGKFITSTVFVIKECQKPQPQLLLQRVSQCTSSLFCNAPPICGAVLSVPLSSDESTMYFQYSSHFCIAIRLPVLGFRLPGTRPEFLFFPENRQGKDPRHPNWVCANWAGNRLLNHDIISDCCWIPALSSMLWQDPPIAATCVSYLLALWLLPCAFEGLASVHAQALKTWVGLPTSWFFNLSRTKMLLSALCWLQKFESNFHDGFCLPCRASRPCIQWPRKHD